MPMAASGESPETNYPESRVLIIMTGGTICMQPSADGLVPMTGFLENAMAPRPSFNDASDPVPLSAYKNGKKLILNSLRTPPTAYSRHVRYTILEFSPLLDSSSISSVGWTEIALTVKENYHLFDGFVVLHGTDSLAYSASALSFMMSDLGKPVILTGSQASIFALQSDAVDNLLGSLIVAGTFQIPEVCLFFHHTLFRGNRTTKVSASAFEAFDSPNCQPLAKVTSLGVDVNWTLVRRPTRIAEFHVTKYIDTAHVACLRIFPGIKPEMIDSVLHVPGLKGLILETFGMGNAPGGVDGSLTKVIKEAVERGIVIVNVSQCTNGFVSPLYAPGTALGRAGVVFGHDLTTEAALTKLGYLLAVQDLSFGDITEKMALSIRGESKYIGVLVYPLLPTTIFTFCELPCQVESRWLKDHAVTEMAKPSFSHPAGTVDSVVSHLTTAEAAFTSLGYAIQRGELESVREMLEGDEFNHQLLHKADYAGNTAMHLAAMSANPEIIKELLTRGASVHTRNHANNTPLFLARRTAHKECVDILEGAGGHLWIDERGRSGASTPKTANFPPSRPMSPGM